MYKEEISKKISSFSAKRQKSYRITPSKKGYINDGDLQMQISDPEPIDLSQNQTFSNKFFNHYFQKSQCEHSKKILGEKSEFPDSCQSVLDVFLATPSVN